MTPRIVYEFADIRVDAGRMTVTRGGTPLALEPKMFDVLRVLIERRDRLVTKDELLDTVWHGTFVTPNVLTRAVARLRKALGDDARQGRFIATSSKRGYRFVAPVTVITAGEDSANQSQNPVSPSPCEVASLHGVVAPLQPPLSGTSRHRLVIGLAGAVVLVAAVTAGWMVGRVHSASATLPHNSIAVLPLANISGDPGQEYLADGVTDAIITGLSKIGGLRRVISRTSTTAYKGTHMSLPEIGRTLQVELIVEGSVVKAGDRVRVSAELRRAATEEPLWAETYERDLRDQLSLQGEVAGAIAQKISLAISPQDRARLAAHPVDPDAHVAYLKGRYHVAKLTRQDIDLAIADFNQALTYDPRSALAHAGLSDAYSALRSTYLPPHEVMPAARLHALKAIELDETLAEGHTALGIVKLYYEWDWAGATREFRRAIELNPGLAFAHSASATTLAASGKFAEAEVEIRRALDLDPVSVPVLGEAGWAYYLGRRYPEAIEMGRRAIEVDPTYWLAYAVQGLAYEKLGRFGEAIATLERARSHDDSPTTLEMLGGAYAAAGREADAERVLLELTAQAKEHYVCPYEVATLYVGLKKPDEALKWLEKGYHDHADCMPWIATDSKLDALRGTREFRDLISRIGIPH